MGQSKYKGAEGCICRDGDGTGPTGGIVAVETLRGFAGEPARPPGRFGVPGKLNDDARDDSAEEELFLEETLSKDGVA